MTAINAYATLSDYQNYIVNRTGGTHAPVTDTIDDTVIEQLLESASRHIESQTMRYYYPRIETHYFDVPEGRELIVDDDLLAVISITNGDGTTLASTEYNLIDRNKTPYYAIRIKPSSTYSWEYDTEDGGELVIGVTAFWGFHSRYTLHGWKAGSTLSEALDTSETEWDVASASLFAAGQLVKVNNELCVVSSAPTGKVNVASRGENGSTAAAHDSGATVYIWQPMEDLRNGVVEWVNNAYHRRFGESLRGEETVTAAGIVISPRDIPKLVKDFIAANARKVR
jgi:hypothetical protein